MALQTKFDSFWSKKLQVQSGDEHPFFGFKLGRSDANACSDINLSEANSYRVRKYHYLDISSRNILFIPELGDTDEDIFYVNGIYGDGAMSYQIELKTAYNTLTGEKYVITYSDPLNESGVYNSLTCSEKVMNIPQVEPISDYIIGECIGQSEEFLPEIL